MLIRKYATPSTGIFEAVLDDLFEFYTMSSSTKVKTPIHDVIENENEYLVELLLAGIKKEDINIDIEKDVLIIKAERKEINDLKYNRKETYFGKYERSFKLPDNVDKEKIDASLTDGILKIIVPKLQNDKLVNKRTIEIK